MYEQERTGCITRMKMKIQNNAFPKRKWQDVSMYRTRTQCISLLGSARCSLFYIYTKQLNNSATQQIYMNIYIYIHISINIIHLCVFVCCVREQWTLRPPSWTGQKWKGKCLNDIILKQKWNKNEKKNENIINFPSTVWYRCSDVTTLVRIALHRVYSRVWHTNKNVVCNKINGNNELRWNENDETQNIQRTDR